LKKTVEDVIGYLTLPPIVHVNASFKANGKPTVDAQKESFEVAVRNSSLDEDRKQALLKD